MPQRHIQGTRNEAKPWPDEPVTHTSLAQASDQDAAGTTQAGATVATDTTVDTNDLPTRPKRGRRWGADGPPPGASERAGVLNNDRKRRNAPLAIRTSYP